MMVALCVKRFRTTVVNVKRPWKNLFQFWWGLALRCNYSHVFLLCEYAIHVYQSGSLTPNSCNHAFREHICALLHSGYRTGVLLNWPHCGKNIIAQMRVSHYSVFFLSSFTQMLSAVVWKTSVSSVPFLLLFYSTTLQTRVYLHLAKHFIADITQ